ncbi:MAG: response regulator, partial [Candidatus Riflebacteria bacterium]
FAPLDWYMVASVYLDELHEPLVSLRWKILLIVAVLLSLALLLASTLSKSISNPINELARTAQKIESEGIFYPDIPSSGTRETRKLANCLNSMLLSLKNASDERDMIFRAIQTEEEKHRIVLNSLAEAVVSTGITGKIQSMNPAAETLTGIIQAEAIGHTVDEICSFFEVGSRNDRKPMSLPCHGKEVEAPLQKDAVLLAKTGEEFQVSIKRSPIHDEDGELKGAVLVFRNVTEELQNLQRLNESEWKFNALVNHGPLGVSFHKMIYDTTGAPYDYYYIDANGPFIQMTGVDPRGKTVREAFPGIENDPYNWISFFGEVAKTGKTLRFQQVLQLSGHCYQGIAFQYKPDHFVAAFIDVTEQRNLEEQLRQAQKMDAVGQLAGGIAHDFNNVLSGIRGAAELIELQGSKDEKIDKFAKVILQATDRASELISKLMAFSRRSSPLSTPVDSHQAVNSALDILRCSIDKKVIISANLQAEKSVIIGDIALLQNVFINLGINASHAMPEGGTFSIESSCVELDSASCQAYDLAPGQYIKFDVRDTGCGISPEIMPRIFEPFFTTKKSGSGTGLGLAASFGIIRQHRGAIFAYSEVGVGTVFHILLPITEKFKPISERAEKPAKGQGVILLIDDEEIILSTISAILIELGYEVITASNGEEGVKIYSAERERIDLVIVDMIMPIMNGKECYLKLRQLCPDVRIILASGFSKEEDLTELKENGLCGFLQKPYGTNELSQLVKKTIRRNPVGSPNC